MRIPRNPAPAISISWNCESPNDVAFVGMIQRMDMATGFSSRPIKGRSVVYQARESREIAPQSQGNTTLYLARVSKIRECL